MVHITLPDGSQREYPGPVTVAEVAASIGAGLAKVALAGKVDGKVVLSIPEVLDSQGVKMELDAFADQYFKFLDVYY